MGKKELKRRVYKVFSDRMMVNLAGWALLALVLEYFVTAPQLILLLDLLSWFVWLAFLAEFALKLYVENNRLGYLSENKLDSGISIIIIATPIAELLVNAFFSASPIVALLRVSNVIKTSSIVRGAAYTSKALLKTNR